jgi:phage gp46-like protein
MRKSPYKRKVSEPLLPLRRENGSLVRCSFEWENIPLVKLQTRTGWWGDLIGDSPVGSLYADRADDPILADGDFLARRNAQAQAALDILKQEQIASKIEVEVTMPEVDRTEAQIRVTTDGESDQEVVLVVTDYRKTDPSVGRILTVVNDPGGVSGAIINTPTTGNPMVENAPQGV